MGLGGDCPQEHVHREKQTGQQWTFYDVINVLVPSLTPFPLVSFLNLWVPCY